mgnify:CR=1 FL=1
MLGAAGSVFYGGKYADKLGALKVLERFTGGAEAAFGPVRDPQFGYVVLGRALEHWHQVSHRNHAGRDLLELEPADHHWLERLDKNARREIQKAFDRCRKQVALSPAQKQNFAQAIEQAMSVYDDWRLNRD